MFGIHGQPEPFHHSAVMAMIDKHIERTHINMRNAHCRNFPCLDILDSTLEVDSWGWFIGLRLRQYIPMDIELLDGEGGEVMSLTRRDIDKCFSTLPPGNYQLTVSSALLKDAVILAGDVNIPEGSVYPSAPYRLSVREDMELPPDQWYMTPEERRKS